MNKTKRKTARVAVAAIFFAVLFAADKIWGFNFYLSLALYGCLYVASGYDVLYKAARNILRGKVFDENFLMTIASLGAFILGIVEGSGDFAESVAVILFYQIGELFQDYAVGKSRRAISELADIRPDKARVARDGEKVEVDPEEVVVGESVFLIAGERIPVDGTIVKGRGNLNVAALTGESLPVFVKEGDSVLSGSIALDGNLEIRVEKEFCDSAASRIMDMVENASGRKAKTEKFISKFAKYYTPFVVGAALALALIPPVIGLVLGDGVSFAVWVKRALTFLVVSCPCALVISIPLGFFGGIGGASGRGILFKGASYIESLDKTTTVLFDKTGTLTTGELSVSGVYPTERREEILKYACVCESKSSHPIAAAIRSAYGGFIPDYDDVEEVAGKGIIARGEKEIVVGNAAFLEELGILFERSKNVGTTAYIAINGEFYGVIELNDSVKPNAKASIEYLKRSGVRVAMLTGDNESVAKAVAERLGVDEYYSELLPQDKLALVEKKISEKKGGEKVAFVGDGINDAPTLARADVGISMGGVGSDIAIEASDVVLMKDDVADIVAAKKIASKTMRIVRENIIFSLGVKAVALVLSAFGLAGMWLAVFADVGVAVLAILNSTRALRS